jgi:thiol:disulfide interchange protein
VHWRPDLGGAMRLAAQRNTIVVAAYWSTFNKDCQQMEDEVFTHPDVVATLKSTIPVRLEAWSNKDFAKTYSLRTVPSFVVFAPDGRVLRVTEGFLNEGRFRGMIEAARLSN